MTPPTPRALGVVPRYTAADGARRRVSAEALRAVTRAMVDSPLDPGAAEAGPLVVVRGACPDAGPGWEVELEDGSGRGGDGQLPADLPLGYHRLHVGGRARALIVTPPRCHLPTRRGFGIAVQLYATRSASSWGIGDLRDLAELGRWARELGASALVVSPLHASLLLPPVQASPYFPTSRVFLNPLHLRPEAAPRGAPLDDLAARARRLNADRRIDRDGVADLKLAALQRGFAAPGAGAEARRALREWPLLADFALFCSLAERHGPDWRRWPRPLARRDPGALRQARDELRGRVRFHAWVQVQLDRQMGAVRAELAPICDLAVGVHPGGADAWMWQDLLAPGMTVGAPPDLYEPRGQDWGVPAFDPGKLRAAGYAPFIATLRAALRHGGGVRIDHVMGLERLWWVPAGLGPARGAYVRYPLDDLLGIVCLESVRHGALVIGEDLGTVPRGLRGRLRRRGLLGYVLLIFEDRPPARWPRRAVAAVTTHDLPTVAGLWDGSDLRLRRSLGLPADPAAVEELAGRAFAGMGSTASVREVIDHVHRRVAASPCLVVTATLEDICAVRERPNQPGLLGPPSWSLALPLPLEAVESLEEARMVAGSLARRSTTGRPAGSPEAGARPPHGGAHPPL